MMVSRRDFVATLALGVACRSVPVPLRPTRQFKVGHTGITWGYAPANAEDAISDVASLGYHAFESFSSVLEYWDQRGGLRRLLDAARIPLRSAYCPFELTNAAVRKAEVAKATKWGTLIRQAGGFVAVIGPNSVKRPGFDFSRARGDMIATLNDIGRALDDVGVVGVVHQHTGSCIETRDETYGTMEAVDSRFVKFGPDVGELQSAGLDPVKVLTDFLPIIGHVHLKDYSGGAQNDGYCPLGRGKVDIAGCVDVVERSSQDLVLMGELNPASTGALYAPIEAARISKTYLQALGYGFRS